MNNLQKQSDFSLAQKEPGQPISIGVGEIPQSGSAATPNEPASAAKPLGGKDLLRGLLSMTHGAEVSQSEAKLTALDNRWEREKQKEKPAEAAEQRVRQKTRQERKQEAKRQGLRLIAGALVVSILLTGAATGDRFITALRRKTATKQEQLNQNYIAQHPKEIVLEAGARLRSQPIEAGRFPDPDNPKPGDIPVAVTERPISLSPEDIASVSGNGNGVWYELTEEASHELLQDPELINDPGLFQTAKKHKGGIFVSEQKLHRPQVEGEATQE